MEKIPMTASGFKALEEELNRLLHRLQRRRQSQVADEVEDDAVATQTGTAEWVSDHSATPLDRFYGLRHEAEGQFGQHVQQVWSELGGAGVGGRHDTSEADVGDGSGNPHGSHRLVLPGDLGTAIDNHMSTAFDGRYLAGVPDAWTYLITGGDRS